MSELEDRNFVREVNTDLEDSYDNGSQAQTLEQHRDGVEPSAAELRLAEAASSAVELQEKGLVADEANAIAAGTLPEGESPKR